MQQIYIVPMENGGTEGKLEQDIAGTSGWVDGFTAAPS